MKDTDWEIIYELHNLPNITKVAEKLFLSQPTLTKRLQAIEDEFKITLVTRTKKGVVFTPEGELLAEKAKKYIEFYEETKKEMSGYSQSTSGTISIASAYTCQHDFLYDILSTYLKNTPNVDFEVQTELSGIIFRKVASGELDIGFITGEYTGKPNRILVDKQKAYVLTPKPFTDWKQLLTMNKIQYRANDYSMKQLNDWWQHNFSQEASEIMSVRYIDFAYKLVEKGLGFVTCFLPDNFPTNKKVFKKELLDAKGNPLIRNGWFIYRQDGKYSKATQDFINYMKSK